MARNLSLLLCIFVARSARLDDDEDDRGKRHGHSTKISSSMELKEKLPEPFPFEQIPYESIDSAAAPLLDDQPTGLLPDPFPAAADPCAAADPYSGPTPLPAAEPETHDSEDPDRFITQLDTVSCDRQRPDLDEGDAAKEEGDRRLKAAKLVADERVQAFTEEMDQKVRVAHEKVLEQASDMLSKARMQSRKKAQLVEQVAENDVEEGREHVRHNVKEAEAAYSAKTQKGLQDVIAKTAEFRSKSTEQMNSMQTNIEREVDDAKERATKTITVLEAHRNYTVEKAKAQAKMEIQQKLNQTEMSERSRERAAAHVALGRVEKAQRDASAQVAVAEANKAAAYSQGEQSLAEGLQAAKLSESQAEEQAIHAETNAKAWAQQKVEKTKEESKRLYDGTVHHIESMACGKLKSVDANCHQKEARTKAEVLASKNHQEDESTSMLKEVKSKADNKTKEIHWRTDEMRKKSIGDHVAIAEKLKKDYGVVDATKKHIVDRAKVALQTAEGKASQERKNANTLVEQSVEESARKEKVAEQDAMAALQRMEKKRQSAQEARDSAREKLKVAEAEALAHIHAASELASKRVRRSQSMSALNIQRAELGQRQRVHEGSLLVNSHLHKHHMDLQQKVTAVDQESKARVHQAEADSSFAVESSHKQQEKAKEDIEEAYKFAEEEFNSAKDKATTWVENSRDVASTRVRETQEVMARHQEHLEKTEEEHEKAQQHAERVTKFQEIQTEHREELSRLDDLHEE